MFPVVSCREHLVSPALTSAWEIQLSCAQGTKKAYRTPHFRGNSSADFHDILSPQFDDCSVPLVWWPWWPFNPGDFFLSSLAPFHAMLNEGVIDRNVRYTPVLEGLTRPGYFQWYFDPITHFPVISHNEATCRDFHTISEHA